MIAIEPNNRKSMADNYLERKMDEYRNPGRRQCNANARIAASFGCPALRNLRVMVVGADDAIVRESVRQFRSAGCRTAFVASDRKAGNAFAQAVGARCYPTAVIDADFIAQCLKDLCYHWHAVDLVVTDGANVDGYQTIHHNEVHEYLANVGHSD